MAMCERPKSVVEQQEEITAVPTAEPVKERRNMVLVGKPAPLFRAPAYHQGEFKEINLEDYKGKWTLLCFYPGDFTFV